MNHRIRLVALASALVGPAIVTAQAPAPPRLMVIQRELVKPGKLIAHNKLETAWSRALEAAKNPTNFIAMTTMSGANEVWWLTSYASNADWQKMNEASEGNAALSAIFEKYVPLEADLLANSFTSTATLRDDLSYSNGTPLPALRYMNVTRVAVRIGHNDEFVEARKIIKAAHEQAKAADGFAVYQVQSGAPVGTFLIFRGLKSLAELDENPHGPAYEAAIGGPEGQKKLNTMLMSYEASSDVTRFQLSPSMSSPSKAWTDADPYWKPKAAAKKAP